MREISSQIISRTFLPHWSHVKLVTLKSITKKKDLHEKHFGNLISGISKDTNRRSASLPTSSIHNVRTSKKWQDISGEFQISK